MKLAIYDFDGTYISKQTLPLMYKLWRKQKLNNKVHRKVWSHILWRYLLYKLKIFGWDKRRINPYSMQQTASLFQSVSSDVLQAFLLDNYHNLQAYIFQPIKEQLKKDKEAGYHTVLLSGNLDIILHPFKEDGFDTIIGSQSYKNNKLLSSNEVEILIEDKKRETILEMFPKANLKESKAYADNGYDIAILEIVGEPCAVNPDKELEKHALKHHWKIIK